MSQAETDIVVRVAHLIRFGITRVAEKPRGAEGFWTERSGVQRASRRVEPTSQKRRKRGLRLTKNAEGWRRFGRSEAEPVGRGGGRSRRVNTIHGVGGPWTALAAEWPKIRARRRWRADAA